MKTPNSEVVSSDSITHRRPCEVRAKRGARSRRVLLASLRSKAVAPRRPALPSLGDSERGRRSRSQPRPRCPGSAASRSTFLPTSRSAPREPAPESSLLGRSRPRTSARRPSRRSMCGPVREVGWLPGRLGRLNSSRTRRLPSELKVQIDTSLVVRGRRHGGAGGHRRERSDPGIRAQLAGAALRASALTPIARGDTRENQNRASK